MERIPNWFKATLLLIFILGVAWVVTTPREPEPFTNKPSQTIEVKFLWERTSRISLGRDTEMRLGILKKTSQAVDVICPRGFNPDPTKTYVVDCFGMTDETGRSISDPVRILHNKTEDVIPMMEQIPNVGSLVFKK